MRSPAAGGRAYRAADLHEESERFKGTTAAFPPAVVTGDRNERRREVGGKGAGIRRNEPLVNLMMSAPVTLYMIHDL